MPDLDWNRAIWDGDYDWSQAGEEWSGTWGGSEAQWFGSLYPRLHKLLPANSILEIGPGFGRWTRFLLPTCNRYVGVDLSQSCIDACQTRFANAPHAKFVKNDGLTLPSGEKFGLIFSFDSLVHADLSVMKSYIPQIISLLAQDGIAFLHHSNESFAAAQREKRWFPAQDRRSALLGRDAGVLGATSKHYRADDVSADLVADIVHGSGGHVILQEIFNWGTIDTDAITVFGAGKPNGPPRRISNRRFLDEATIIAKMQRPYCDIR